MWLFIAAICILISVYCFIWGIFTAITQILIVYYQSQKEKLNLDFSFTFTVYKLFASFYFFLGALACVVQHFN